MEDAAQTMPTTRLQLCQRCHGRIAIRSVAASPLRWPWRGQVAVCGVCAERDHRERRRTATQLGSSRFDPVHRSASEQQADQAVAEAMRAVRELELAAEARAWCSLRGCGLHTTPLAVQQRYEAALCNVELAVRKLAGLPTAMPAAAPAKGGING